MQFADYLNLDINYWAVLLAAVAYYLIGALWYSPKVFGHHWIKHENLQAHEIAPNIGTYIGEFALDLVIAFVLAIFIELADIQDWKEGILVALWAWIGFVATTQLSSILWSRRTFHNFLINAGFVLVGLLVMGGIIGFISYY